MKRLVMAVYTIVETSYQINGGAAKKTAVTATCLPIETGNAGPRLCKTLIFIDKAGVLEGFYAEPTS